MSGKKKTVLLIGLMLLCGLAGLAAIIGYAYLGPPSQQPDRAAQAEARPVVLITAPESGEQVALDEPTMVHVVARGRVKIARVELWIDGQLFTAQGTNLAEGSSPLPLVLAWQPGEPGTHTLMARAFDVQGERAQATIEVEAGAKSGGADRDGDGVADAVDACADEPGWAATGGCPDRDGDGVADGVDGCPDIPGGGDDGCASPTSEDRDGDGVPDADDACPDEPGRPTLDGCPLPGDRDGDEIADEDDACPDEAGSTGTDGCPDRDADRVPDGEDACPDEPGPPEDGCPAPTGGDRDGDGFPDGEDECPDVPGVPETWGCPDRDHDGVRDGADECPDAWGPPENRGCPVEDGAGPGGGPGETEGDTDGDGVLDEADPCPDEPGPPELDGCPDRDGDGIPDWWDHCPDEPGVPEAAGCPEEDIVGDRDGDGAPDDVDLCPDEPGEPEHGGCPPPEEDEGEMLEVGEIDPGRFFEEVRIPVEFQAISFRVSDGYDGVYCYPRLVGASPERLEFGPLGEQEWDIATELGSRTLATPLSEPIEIEMECGADTVFAGPGGGWGTYWNIGTFVASHPSADWDGHVITARSSGGDDGRWFEVQYRLCAGSCEETAYPAPVLGIFHGMGEDALAWQWDGDLDRIRSYDVYMDGSRIVRMRATTDRAVLDIGDYAPLCGARHEFIVVATGEDGRQSPPSNMVVWEAEACPRVVRVTFDAISTFHLGNDEWWADGNSVGPIGGNFWAAGSTTEELNFNAVDYGEWAWERIRGYRLQHTHYYPIQEIFDQIWTWIGGRMSSPYRAPDTNHVTIELGPDDDLTFGGLIYDADSDNPSDTLFDGQHAIPAREVRPGRYTIWDRNIELTVLVDVIVGPEVGSGPDLAITNVDRHEPSGQLRVHVFNNASDMAEPADVTVHWVEVGSAEVVGRMTWEDIQIPSGGSHILQMGEPLETIGGMLFVLDPEEAIPDENRGNNTFETPLTMRVEFLEVGAPHCSESGCSIFDCDSEWKFNLSAGYGPSEGEVTWVARGVRFPSSDKLIACAHDACMYKDSPDEDWRMEGDERYTFEFEMPAMENVYVRLGATELDVWTSDDHFSSPLYQYTSRDSWGARSDPYSGDLAANRSCNDAACSTCREGNVWARWRITRVD